jgi:hypothetical protein
VCGRALAQHTIFTSSCLPSPRPGQSETWWLDIGSGDGEVGDEDRHGDGENHCGGAVAEVDAAGVAHKMVVPA